MERIRIHRQARPAVLASLLIALTVAVFWQVQTFDFVRFDDPLYVVDNHRVLGGIDLGRLKWAFTTGESASWQPVTWISLMLDVEMFGVKARGFHRTNLVIHLVNVLLVFLLLRRMTGATWNSAIAAAMFAVHPLRVEPVAWISERKGLLSMLFGLFALGAYLPYVRTRKRGWLAISLACFAISLMSKQMLVTFPCLLLLLDYWPLKRMKLPFADAGSEEPIRNELRSFRELLLEKIPYFLLTVAFSISAYALQTRAGAVSSLSDVPMKVRITNAIAGLGFYLAKTFWPTKFAVFYPHTGEPAPFAQLAASAISLLLVTAIVLHERTRRPYLLVGWFWYLGSLVPVIGLVQIGGARWAIRYSYVPLLGVFIAVTWLVDSLLPSRGWQRALKIALAAAAIFACALVSSRELEHWRNTATLFMHDLQSVGDNHVALNNAANALMKQGDHEEALALFERATRLRPDDYEIRLDYGVALHELKRWDDALWQYQEALRINPDSAAARNHIGNVYFAQQNYDEATAQYNDAVRVDPDYAATYNNLGNVFHAQGDEDKAIAQYERAIDLEPYFDEAHVNLGRALQRAGRLDAAIEQFQQAARIQPANVDAFVHLGQALQSAGRFDEAATSFRAALDIDAHSEPALRGLQQVERAP